MPVFDPKIFDCGIKEKKIPFTIYRDKEILIYQYKVTLRLTGKVLPKPIKETIILHGTVSSKYSLYTKTLAIKGQKSQVFERKIKVEGCISQQFVQKIKVRGKAYVVKKN